MLLSEVNATIWQQADAIATMIDESFRPPRAVPNFLPTLKLLPVKLRDVIDEVFLPKWVDLYTQSNVVVVQTGKVPDGMEGYIRNDATIHSFVTLRPLYVCNILEALLEVPKIREVVTEPVRHSVVQGITLLRMGIRKAKAVSESIAILDGCCFPIVGEWARAWAHIISNSSQSASEEHLGSMLNNMVQLNAPSGDFGILDAIRGNKNTEVW